MKKSVALVMAAGFVMTSAAAFAADPVQIDGSIKYEYRHNDEGATYGTYKAGDNNYSASRFYVGINIKGKIDENTTYFGRVAGKQVVGSSNTGAANDFKLDQYGVKTDLDGWKVSLGRQGAQLGAGGTFYAGGDIAPLSYFDGVVVNNKLGDVNFKAVGGKTTAAPTSAATNWYGADVSTDLSKDVNMGLAYANSKVAGASSKNYWSAYTTVKGGALTWTGEYVKSNANAKNTAYDVSGTYGWGNDSFTVQYNNVQANSTDVDNSSIGTEYYPNGNDYNGVGYKGFTYVYHHGINTHLGFNTYLLSLKPLTGTGTNNELGVNLKWTF